MRATWLDRAIGWVSPQRGYERVQYRAAMDLVRSYEAARAGRRRDGWVSSAGSADADAVPALASLRQDARSLVRDNPWAVKGLETIVSNTVGNGITASAATSSRAANKKLDDIWNVWVEECDAEEALDFYGIQSLAVRSRCESGEVLVRFINVRESEAGFSRVPLRLQVLEADFLDSAKEGRTAEGNTIRAGIEYAPSGKVVAYWLFPSHPGDRTPILRSSQSVRILASEVIHLYRKLRPGQTRGVTDFAPVMLRLRSLDDWDDAALLAKKIAACLAAFVTTPSGVAPARIGPASTDEKGIIEEIYPGMIKYLRPGEQITIAEPKGSSEDGGFRVAHLRAIAAGLGMPYELLSGDLSLVNYSSYRAGLIDHRRRIEADQYQMVIPRLCSRVRRRFVDAVAISNPGLAGRYETDWTPPKFETIDPQKETAADVLAMKAGLLTWAEAVRRWGYDPERQLAEIAEWGPRLRDAGITFDTAPGAAPEDTAPAPAAAAGGK